ncbi:bacteriocin immunity protein [Jiangella sp. DSM 45060]|uniref:bacteriocin immunity protein n=1 Tax=Jiangella sp. DSM 45060 TaxID=1798224 RepID=UPI00087B20C9|nr:bacteriocin immunity protein [Jiangella sp. DSM 45060]SDS80900.1 Colicin immunity protein / pyocin immunity protein [Jiangella sp. DSM 45060]
MRTPSERQRLIDLVARLQAGEYTSEAEADRDAEDFEAAVPHPRALGLIFWPDREFDHEPTPDEVVDRALAYRPIAL